MFKKYFGIVATVGIMSVLAACSGGTMASAPKAPAAAAPTTSDKLSITATDSKYDTMSWTVAAGKPVSITLTNKGALEHEWVLIKKDAKVTVPFSDDDESKVYWEMEAQPGQANTETFTAPTERGTYEVVCGTPGHIEAGMAGSLIVE